MELENFLANTCIAGFVNNFAHIAKDIGNDNPVPGLYGQALFFWPF